MRSIQARLLTTRLALIHPVLRRAAESHGSTAVSAAVAAERVPRRRSAKRHQVSSRIFDILFDWMNPERDQSRRRDGEAG